MANSILGPVPTEGPGYASPVTYPSVPGQTGQDLPLYPVEQIEAIRRRPLPTRPVAPPLGFWDQLGQGLSTIEQPGAPPGVPAGDVFAANALAAFARSFGGAREAARARKEAQAEKDYQQKLAEAEGQQATDIEAAKADYELKAKKALQPPREPQMTPEQKIKQAAAEAYATTKARNKAEVESEPQTNLDPAALEGYARYVAGGGKLTDILPSRSQKNANLINYVNTYAFKKYPKLDLLGNRADRIANQKAYNDAVTADSQNRRIEQTLLSNVATLEGYLPKIPDTGAEFANKPLRSISGKVFSGGDLAAYNTALNTVSAEAARLLQAGATGGGGQLTDTARRELQAVLSPDFTKRQMVAALGVIKIDAANKRRAIEDNLQFYKDKLSWNDERAAQLGDTSAPAPAAPTWQPSPGSAFDRFKPAPGGR